MSDRPVGALVSVIVPCYNRERFIAATVESVLSQTWPTVELIVVDDGCADRSRAVLECFGQRVSVLEHPLKANRGQAASINLGLRWSTGDYIAILDSDDLFVPEKLQKQIAFLEAHPDFGLVYSNGTYIDEEGNRLHPMYTMSHRPPLGPEEVLESSWFNVPSNSLFRRSVFERVGYFDESLRAAQDHDYAIRIAEVTKIGYLNECLWKYRRHPGSISASRTMERWQNGFKILKAARGRYPYPSTVIRRRRAVLHFRLGQCFVSERQFLPAAWHLSLAAALDPIRSIAVLTRRQPLTGPQ